MAKSGLVKTRWPHRERKDSRERLRGVGVRGGVGLKRKNAAGMDRGGVEGESEEEAESEEDSAYFAKGLVIMARKLSLTLPMASFGPVSLMKTLLPSAVGTMAPRRV